MKNINVLTIAIPMLVALFPLSQLAHKIKSDVALITTVKSKSTESHAYSFPAKKMTKFNPQVHGFAFANSFSNHGFAFGIHLDFSGLCGGMSYAALDYFKKGKPIPSTTKRPNEGTKLTSYIRSRQWKSFDNQADKWIELGFNPFGWRTSEFWNWGIQHNNGGRLEELMTEINKGNPVVLGLFAAGGGGLTKDHHQILAIGYDIGNYNGNTGRNIDDIEIYVYDPNYPKRTMTLQPFKEKHRFGYKENNKEQWLTYFVDKRYKATTPLDPKIIDRCSGLNFRGKNLSSKTFNKKSFRCLLGDKVNFKGSNVSGTDLYNADLAGAIFYGANCRNSNFEKADLRKADFYGADLKNCNFSQSSLNGARFYGADLKYAIASKADMGGANLEGADLHKGKFRYTSFKNAHLKGTSLNTADCKNADFAGANLDGADLRGANLYGANFENARITRNTLIDKKSLVNVKKWPGVK